MKLPRKKVAVQTSIALLVTFLFAYASLLDFLVPVRVSKLDTLLAAVAANDSIPASCKSFITRSIAIPLASDEDSDNVVPRIAHFLHYNQNFTSPRYLCAIESFHFQNPDFEISIHVANAVTFMSAIHPWLTQSGLSQHLSIRQIDYSKEMAETPLEPWYENGVWKESRWPEQNLGNALRLALVHNYGGIYLDLDIISLNPVSAGKRMVAMQDPKSMNNAFLSLEKGDQFAWWLMEEFVRGFKGNIWGRNGPEVVIRTFNKYCKPKEKAAPKSECKTIKVIPANQIYPFGYRQKHLMFESWEENCDFLDDMAAKSIGLHWWNKRAKSVEFMSNKTILSVVMQTRCPALFEAYTDKYLGIDVDAKLGALQLITEDPELMKPGAKKQ
ncbi:UNVERIFIED_CONTAM: hypothetical protein HDU68_012865 [Siphonaria sp. JEL0065]|nr:hypothetical protein HDU68_012865 [Siphonaria sp. JEL0065]